MKDLAFTLILIVVPFLAQKTEAQEADGVFVNYEKMPEYPGGDKQWKQDSEAYMGTKLKNMFPQANPDSLATDERKRRIVVQCIIDKEGIAQDPIIVPGHGLHPVLDEVAISYVHQMPRLKPGTVKGEPRNVKYVMPIFVHSYYLRLLERGEQPADTTIYEVVERMPEYPGGAETIIKYLRTCTENYWKKVAPEVKREWIRMESIHRKVVVSLIIDESGQVTDPVIKRSVSPELDKEAIHIVKSMPRWIPGEHKGNKVKVKIILPITF